MNRTAVVSYGGTKSPVELLSWECDKNVRNVCEFKSTWGQKSLERFGGELSF